MLDVSVSQVESNLPGEDRYAMRCTKEVFAVGVFDGHGGFLAADIAVATLLDAIVADVAAEPLSSSDARIAEVIDAAFAKCEAHILAEALRLHREKPISNSSTTSSSSSGSVHFTTAFGGGGGGGRGSSSSRRSSHGATEMVNVNVPKVMGRAGTCAVVAVVFRGVLFVAHVGDCRAVLMRNEVADTVPVDVNASNGSVDSKIDTLQSRATEADAKNDARLGNDENVNNSSSSSGRAGEVSLKSVQPLDATVVSGLARPLSVPSSNSAASARHHGGAPNATTSSQPSCGSVVSSVDKPLLSPYTFTVYDSFLKEVESNRPPPPPPPPSSSSSSTSSSTSSSSSHSLKTYSKRPARVASRAPERTAAEFISAQHGIVAEGITLDHSCDVPVEADGVRSLTSDPHPIRPSDNDRRVMGLRAPLRVAGSLAVTRALGDPYLKLAELSMPIFIPHLPYITGRPTISYRALLPTDRAIVLASDGLWNFIHAEDCCDVLQSFLPTAARSGATTDVQKDRARPRSSSGTGAGTSTSTGTSTFTRTGTGTGTSTCGIGSGDNMSSKRQKFIEENVAHHDGRCANRRSSSNSSSSSSAAAGACSIMVGDEKCRPVHRVARVTWANQHLENDSFTFALDSHVAETALNAYGGFVPSTTAAANAVLLPAAPEGGFACDGVDDLSPATDGGTSSGATEAETETETEVGTEEDSQTDAQMMTSAVHPDAPAPDPATAPAPPLVGPVSVLRVTSTTHSGSASSKESVALSQSVVRQEGDAATQVHATAAWRPAVAAHDAVSTKSAHAGIDSFVGRFVYDFYSSRPAAAAAGALLQATAARALCEVADPGVYQGVGTKVGAGHERGAVPAAQYYSAQVAVNEGPAAALMECCLQHAAANSSHGGRGTINAEQLRKLPQGPSRRSIVDDITVLVVTFTQ